LLTGDDPFANSPAGDDQHVDPDEADAAISGNKAA
jgi:hypothetical protein